MRAVFDLDGEDYENEFELRIEDRDVTAYRYGRGEWKKMPDGESIYPGSAYPLLIPFYRRNSYLPGSARR